MFHPHKHVIFTNSHFFITYISLYMLSHACMHIQLDSFFLDSYLILRKNTYPRKKTYCPVKLSTFPLRWSKTNWGRMATASKYIENAQKICNRYTLTIAVGQIATIRLRIKQKNNYNTSKQDIGIWEPRKCDKTQILFT